MEKSLSSPFVFDHDYGLLDSFFIVYIVIYYYHFSFGCLNCLKFAQYESLQASSCVPFLWTH